MLTGCHLIDLSKVFILTQNTKSSFISSFLYIDIISYIALLLDDVLCLMANCVIVFISLS